MESLNGDNSPTLQHTTTRQPRFDGEDVSPTTVRELRGFYAYGVAAEIFAVCGVGKRESRTHKHSPDVGKFLLTRIGSFLPVTLEQLAREKGVLWSDRTTSCVTNKVAEHGEAAVRHLVTRVANSTDNQCVVRVYGAEMTTSSFAMYTFSAAVFVQALALISFSGVADRGKQRLVYSVSC
jgi:UMF1 family MFS transporter